MSGRICSALLLLVAPALVAGHLTSTPAYASFPGENGKIAFLSGQYDHRDIHVINADGTGQSDLTKNQANNRLPVWSPNGSGIAYFSDGDGLDNAYDVYAINADGSGLTNLSRNGDDVVPAWSPDGSKIAFVSGRQPPGIYIMDADGGNPTYLTELRGTGPTWSRDGIKIAHGTNEIYVINVDGTESAQLTHTSFGWSSGAVWSPDSRRIAFTSYGGVDADIHVMNADGSGQVRVTDGPTWDSAWGWSPDGTKILFTADSAIYTMNPDGTAKARLAIGGEPKWSPDGRRIVFTYNGDIYTMSANGSEQANVTNDEEFDLEPDWQPLVRSSFTSASAFCRAQREAQGERAYKERYGRSGFRNCIRQAPSL
jgi:Tol biopolymer transport system component